MKIIRTPITPADGTGNGQLLTAAFSAGGKAIPLSDICLFDIETTGFAADVTFLYLIGCLTHEADGWVMTQFFAEDGASEQQILSSFLEFVRPYQAVMHFHGNGFDLPYLKKKYEKYGIPFEPSGKPGIDCYQVINPYRKLLALKNLKQRTVEEYMGIFRDDPYDGGETAKQYQAFVKATLMKQPEAEELFDLLLLHNHDDLTGLLGILPLVHFFQSAEHLPLAGLPERAAGPQELHFTAALPYPLPLSFAIRQELDAACLSCDGKTLCLSVVPEQKTEEQPEGTLHYYYPDYKEYYYLPKEDMAVHKSIGRFVEKAFRTKATRENCYTRIQAGRLSADPQAADDYFHMMTRHLLASAASTKKTAE